MVITQAYYYLNSIIIGQPFIYMKLFSSYLLAIIVLFSCQETPNKITIATAANVQFAMQELAAVFTEDTGIATEIILGSSGKILAQIKEGAPYDVFVSANIKYPNSLFNAGHTVQKPEVYGYGKLVLWTTTEGIKPSLQLLTTESITHIAIANPKTAPYGVAAEELLKHYGIYEQVKGKLVFGESLSQTNLFINSGAAEIGFTALAVVKSPKLLLKGNWLLLDSSTYTPIAQGVVVIKKEGKNTKQIQAFYRFLFSPKGRSILKKYGYD